ncbi:hypothetical protein EYF80_010176 [Liparis tanakae]|uniref:Uncharacterized protein n=1 Tax=Liparis tanakae TaxID=230148 RepID=A0A4Z2IQ19_9TELE|nr:hypothetical protein EYF80_010176 [Liparis tanakae]
MKTILADDESSVVQRNISQLSSASRLNNFERLSRTRSVLSHRAPVASSSRSQRRPSQGATRKAERDVTLALGRSVAARKRDEDERSVTDAHGGMRMRMRRMNWGGAGSLVTAITAGMVNPVASNIAEVSGVQRCSIQENTALLTGSHGLRRYPAVTVSDRTRQPPAVLTGSTFT